MLKNLYTSIFFLIFIFSLYLSSFLENKTPVSFQNNKYNYLCENKDNSFCALYKKILFAQKSKTNKYENLFYQNGLGHLLSISGLHLYSIFNICFIIFNLIFYVCFRKIIKCYAIFRYSLLFALFMCAIYLFEIDISISRLRSLIMLSLFIISYKVEVFQRPINIILFSASLVVLVYPELSPSFYYSYISVLAISLSKRKKIVEICVLIFVFLIPLNLFYSGNINTASLISNVIFVSFFTYIYFPSLLIYALFVKVFPQTLSSLINNLTSLFVYLLEKFLYISQTLTFHLGFIDLYKTLYLFLIIFVFYMLFIYKLVNYKSIIIMFIFISLPALAINYDGSKGLSIKVFDLDKKFKSKASGDFILININNKNIMFDTGYINTKKVIKKISSSGIRDIDLLILSHDHEDHIGGISEVLNSFKVKNVIVSPFFKLKKVFKSYSYACKDSKIVIEKNFEIKILNPDCSNKKLKENNLAISFIFKYYDMNYLFFSDLEDKKIIKNIIDNLDIDFEKTIIQYPHHCSKTIELPNIKPYLAFCTRSKYLLNTGLDIFKQTYPIYQTGRVGDIIIKQSDMNLTLHYF